MRWPRRKEAGSRRCQTVPPVSTPVALEGADPGPLAARAGPVSGLSPAPGMVALPPLALGVWVAMPLERHHKWPHYDCISDIY